MEKFTNRITKLTTWLYYKKYISKKIHDLIMVELASHRYERKSRN